MIPRISLRNLINARNLINVFSGHPVQPKAFLGGGEDFCQSARIWDLAGLTCNLEENAVSWLKSQDLLYFIGTTRIDQWPKHYYANCSPGLHW